MVRVRCNPSISISRANKKNEHYADSGWYKRSVVREETNQGYHENKVIQKGSKKTPEKHTNKKYSYSVLSRTIN